MSCHVIVERAAQKGRQTHERVAKAGGKLEKDREGDMAESK